VITEEGPMAV
jgi:hypothetical protein